MEAPWVTWHLPLAVQWVLLSSQGSAPPHAVGCLCRNNEPRGNRSSRYLHRFRVFGIVSAPLHQTLGKHSKQHLKTWTGEAIRHVLHVTCSMCLVGPRDSRAAGGSQTPPSLPLSLLSALPSLQGERCQEVFHFIYNIALHTSSERH